MKSKESIRCNDKPVLMLKEYLIKIESCLTETDIRHLREKFENSQSKYESSKILSELFSAIENFLFLERIDHDILQNTSYLQQINDQIQKGEIERLEEELGKVEEKKCLLEKNKQELSNLQNVIKSLISKNSKYVMHYPEYEQIFEDSNRKAKDKFTDEEKKYVYDVLGLEKLSGPKFSFGVMVFRNRTNEEFLKVFSSGTNILEVNNDIMVLDAYDNFYSAYRGKKYRINKNKRTK